MPLKDPKLDILRAEILEKAKTGVMARDLFPQYSSSQVGRALRDVSSQIIWVTLPNSRFRIYFLTAGARDTYFKQQVELRRTDKSRVPFNFVQKIEIIYPKNYKFSTYKGAQVQPYEPPKALNIRGGSEDFLKVPSRGFCVT